MAGGFEYAVCSTTYNCAARIPASLDSLRSAFPDDGATEFVIVDNLSTDGTREVLEREKARTPHLRILDLRCKRGKGRQVAYRKSTARFVVRCDLDTVYSPALADLVRRHREWPDRDRLAVGTRYLDIFPRSLLDELGGWKDLNVGEDYDLWLRARHARRLVYLADDLGANWTASDPERRHERRLLPYARRHFVATRDQFRADARLSLRRRLKGRWAKAPSKLRFALLGLPTIVAAWASALPTRKFRPRDLGPKPLLIELKDFGAPVAHLLEQEPAAAARHPGSDDGPAWAGPRS